MILDDQDYEELKRHQIVANPHSIPSHAAHHHLGGVSSETHSHKLMTLQTASKLTAPGDFAFIVDNTAILHKKRLEEQHKLHGDVAKSQNFVPHHNLNNHED